MTERQQLDSTKPKRNKKEERREESTRKILDVAEMLFGERGFHGVTLRDVAREAGVDTSLVHYYFKDKTDLFNAVFVRRAPEVNDMRMLSMLRYEAEVGRENMKLEGIIHAFLRPFFEKLAEGGPGWRSYGALVGTANSSPSWGRQMMTQTYDKVALHLINLFRELMPHAPEEDLFWSYHFLSGAYTFSLAQTERVDALSRGLCSSTDMKAIAARMAPLFAEGIQAMCRDGRRADVSGWGEGERQARARTRRKAQSTTGDLVPKKGS
jgi:AcrR family transcriptional regulator